MGKVTGFLEIERQDRKYTPAADRIRHEYYNYRRYRLSGQDEEVPLPLYGMERVETLLRLGGDFIARHLPFRAAAATDDHETDRS